MGSAAKGGFADRENTLLRRGEECGDRDHGNLTLKLLAVCNSQSSDSMLQKMTYEAAIALVEDGA